MFFGLHAGTVVLSRARHLVPALLLFRIRLWHSTCDERGDGCQEQCVLSGDSACSSVFMRALSFFHAHAISFPLCCSFEFACGIRHAMKGGMDVRNSACSLVTVHVLRSSCGHCRSFTRTPSRSRSVALSNSPVAFD